MPTFDVDRDEITAFEIEGRYLFKEYFEQEDLFGQLKTHYNNEKYRFGVPEGELDNIRQILEEFFYDLKIAEDPKQYCVITEKDFDSTELLKSSVLRKQRGNQVIYLMKDKLSLDQAVEKGATPLTETGLNEQGLRWRID